MTSFENYSLLGHNTFGVDVTCRRFVEYGDVDELREILAGLSQHPQSPFLAIGGGSNLLFTDHYEGTILHSAIRGRELVSEEQGVVRLRVGAGEVWDDLVDWCVAHGYYGLENLSYIPGEAGAAAVQNIGAYGKEVGDYIESVETLSVETGEVRVFQQKECEYAYRYSIFKGPLRGKYIVTAVVLRLSTRFEPDLSYGALSRELSARGISPDSVNAQLLRKLIIEVRRSKLPEPAELGSAGSFFMNPVVEAQVAEELLQKYPEMPHYSMPTGVKIPAGWLIEQCGWKGKRVGRVGVYEKQALVLVNFGGGTGKDISDLSRSIQEDVRRRFGIDIYPEVNFIG